MRFTVPIDDIEASVTSSDSLGQRQGRGMDLPYRELAMSFPKIICALFISLRRSS